MEKRVTLLSHLDQSASLTPQGSEVAAVIAAIATAAIDLSAVIASGPLAGITGKNGGPDLLQQFLDFGDDKGPAGAAYPGGNRRMQQEMVDRRNPPEQILPDVWRFVHGAISAQPARAVNLQAGTKSRSKHSNGTVRRNRSVR